VTGPAVTVVIPARNEAERLPAVLGAIGATVRSRCEVLVVVDAPDDPTVAAVRRHAPAGLSVRCLVGGYGPGPAQAIRYGLDRARGRVAVVTMADGSDDVGQIDALAALVDAGAVVAAASRYAPGGRQVGGPAVKRALSRLAGRSLRLLAGTGTSDATNSFKAYSTAFVREVGIETTRGFAVGIELTAKAHRLRRPVAELPTTWVDRRPGESAFRLIAWLPEYLRWYRRCFGPPLGPRSGGAAREGRPGPAAGEAVPRAGEAVPRAGEAVPRAGEALQ